LPEREDRGRVPFPVQGRQQFTRLTTYFIICAMTQVVLGGDVVEATVELAGFYPIGYDFRPIRLLRAAGVEVAQPLVYDLPTSQRRMNLTPLMVSGFDGMINSPPCWLAMNCHVTAGRLTKQIACDVLAPPVAEPVALPKGASVPLGKQALVGREVNGLVVIGHSIVGMGEPAEGAQPECMHRLGSADPIGISNIEEMLQAHGPDAKLYFAA